jgi:hypothetical protein
MVEIVDTPARIEAFLPVADGHGRRRQHTSVTEGQAIFHLPLAHRRRHVHGRGHGASDHALNGDPSPCSSKEVSKPCRHGRNADRGIITGGDLLTRGGMRSA